MRKALVPVALALTAATACGSGSGSSKDALSSLEQVRAAASTTEVGSHKLDLSFESKYGDQRETFRGTGAFAYDSSGARGFMTMSIGGQNLEERILGGDLYLKVPGKQGFYKLATKELVGTQLADSTSPSSTAKVLAVTDDVKQVGSETLHGDKTTHYTGTIDVAKASAKLHNDMAKAAVQKLADSGVTTMPVDVFLDDKGRLRRFVEHLTLTLNGTTRSLSVAIDFYDFGTQVKVEAPPPAEVMDGSEILAVLKANG